MEPQSHRDDPPPDRPEPPPSVNSIGKDVSEAAGALYEVRIATQRRRHRLNLDAAREIVHDGTIRALSTDSLPEIPNAAWFAAVDESAYLDERRGQQRARAAYAAVAAGATIGAPSAPTPARGADTKFEGAHVR